MSVWNPETRDGPLSMALISYHLGNETDLATLARPSSETIDSGQLIAGHRGWKPGIRVTFNPTAGFGEPGLPGYPATNTVPISLVILCRVPRRESSLGIPSQAAAWCAVSGWAAGRCKPRSATSATSALGCDASSTGPNEAMMCSWCYEEILHILQTPAPHLMLLD